VVFPAIPGVASPHHLGAGPRGPNRVNPDAQRGGRGDGGQPMPLLVPQVDEDGNELGGIHLPEISVPLATYTGWNLRDPSIGAPAQRLPFEGSFIAFPKTAAARKESGDPRKSIAERYTGREDYLNKFAAAADDLIKQRWILPEDRSALLERGAKEWDLLTQ